MDAWLSVLIFLSDTIVMDSKELSPDQRLVCPDAITSVELDGERVLLNIETAEYYGLNSMGATIFALVEDEPTITEVIQVVQEMHPTVDAKRVQADVLAFIERMESYELLRITEQASAA